MTVKPIFIRAAEMKSVFGISRATAYRLAAAGKIRIYKNGGASLFKVKEIEKYLESAA